ncbi:MAG: deoxyribonuclease IV [Caldilineales bacterium]|nr:deoxyribonuclease IV [Caldilineales bacterium]MDW8317094.1 deoxyribonuclease IV [Anaerolineae bacterium]
MVPKLGAHMSTAGGVSKAFERGRSIGCDTMQIFTRNQNRWDNKPLAADEIERWHAAASATGIAPVVSHASYLINLGSPDDALWEKSIEAMVDELQRAEALGLLGVVVHPGAHMEQGEEAGIARVIAGLDRIHAATPGFRTLTLLEITAGQGSTLGYRFEHLAAMRRGAANPERIAVCFDTCHAFAAGYDLRTPETYAATMAEFDRVIGLDLLKCFHFNDSKGALGNRKDRHEHIGKGGIGLSGFAHILNDPRFVHVPMILETPKSDDMHEDVENLAVLRSLIHS